MPPTAFDQINNVPKTHHLDKRAVKSHKEKVKTTKELVLEKVSKSGQDKQRKALADKRKPEAKAEIKDQDKDKKK